MNHVSGLIVVTLVFASPAFAQLSSGSFRGPSADLAEPGRPRTSPGDNSSREMRKVSTPIQMSGFYGNLDLRHTSNDYYDEDGQLLKQEPAMHAKFRMGGNFYNRTLDVSLGVGAAKLPGTQRVYQKRPDLTVDMYPYRGSLFNLMVYGSALFPVRAEDLDPTEYADGDRHDRDYRRAIDATVISVGLAPNVKLEQSFAVGRASVIVGADVWTRMYSKPIYISESDGSRDLGLVEAGSPAIDEPFEDRAMRYVQQASLALGFSPAILSKLHGEIAGYSESRYLPRYYYSENDDSWSYKYAPERISFTRFKLDYNLTASTTLSNELYFFRNGFFAQDRINDQRRFRNIIRLAIKL